jgi:RNA polymerase sigma factor (TIGR02999 family)
MSDVSRILSQIESGDPSATEQLLPLVYDELRKLAAAKLAQEKPGQTLQATALVHEAYVRLVSPPSSARPDISDQADRWNSRGHFFAAAAEAMRRILVDQARSKGRHKRRGSRQRVDIDAIDVAIQATPDQLLAY